MSPTARLTSLKLGAAAIMAFAPLVALGAHPATAGLNGLLIDLIYWPSDGLPLNDAPAARLLSAICGGVMLGWGLMLWMVATKLYLREPDLARSLILPGVVVWYVADSLGSVVAGAPLNALLNLVFLALFYVPLSNRQKTAAA